MSERRKILIMAIAVGVFTAAIMTVAAMKWANFGYNGFDLAIYNQTFWNTVHGRFFENSMNPPSYLGDHAEWPILLLALPYALVPHPLTLIFFQAAALGLSAFIIFRIAKIYFPGRKMDLFFALLWLANPFMWNLALFEFHIIAFAVPLILLAAYLYLQKRWLPFLAASVGVALVREDMFLVCIGFALLSLFDRRKILKWALPVAIIGIAAFLFDQAMIGHFNPDGRYKFFIYYMWLGPNPGAAILAGLADPLKVIAHLFSLKMLGAVCALLLPTLFLPLVRPRFLLLCFGAALEFGLSITGLDMVVVKTQYVAAFVPALALAAIEGYAWIEKRKRAWKILPKPLFPLFIAIATACVWFGFGPGIGIASSFSADRHDKDLKGALALLPEDASIASSFDALASVSSRRGAFPLAYVFLGQKQFATSAYVLPYAPDYLLFDEQDFIYFTGAYSTVDWSSRYYREGDERLSKLIADGNYGTIYEKGGVALLKRGIGGKLPLVDIYETTPAISHPYAITSGPVRFLGWNETPDGRRLYFSAVNGDGGNPAAIVNGRALPLGNGLYPVSRWKKDEVLAIEAKGVGSPMSIRIIDLTGGLLINGDGSLTLSVNAAKELGPEISVP